MQRPRPASVKVSLGPRGRVIPPTQKGPDAMHSPIVARRVSFSRVARLLVGAGLVVLALPAVLAGMAASLALLLLTFPFVALGMGRRPRPALRLHGLDRLLRRWLPRMEPPLSPSNGI